MKKAIITEITPTNGRKSFYGHAKMLTFGDAKYLRSYDTTVAGYKGGKVYRYWDGRTNQTTGHLTSFFDALGVNMDIKGFYQLPLAKAPTICI